MTSTSTSNAEVRRWVDSHAPTVRALDRLVEMLVTSPSPSQPLTSVLLSLAHLVEHPPQKADLSAPDDRALSSETAFLVSNMLASLSPVSPPASTASNMLMSDGSPATILFAAVSSGNSRAVSAVLSSADSAGVSTARDCKGRTPLHLACSTVSVDASLAVIGRGALVNAGDMTGRTPLHYLAAAACRVAPPGEPVTSVSPVDQEDAELAGTGALAPVSATAVICLWRAMTGAGADATGALDTKGLSPLQAAPSWLRDAVVK
eukprot:TRINITY_DN72508_c0_g1_i1.p1 TRINITY_DN72508_c0_g1~~TRINITY_DN72508_c0_g1_i1.p1  ORF type:complete len:262 (+),score=26.75 TRINITY_DN72508_c0_g1_i1:180-965(+)